MRARDGQKRNAEHFQSQMEGRRGLDASKVGSVGRKNEVDTVSIFLQLSNYLEARSAPGYAIRRPLCGARRRAPAGDSAAAALRSPDRNDRFPRGIRFHRYRAHARLQNRRGARFCGKYGTRCGESQAADRRKIRQRVCAGAKSKRSRKRRWTVLVCADLP